MNSGGFPSQRYVMQLANHHPSPAAGTGFSSG